MKYSTILKHITLIGAVIGFTAMGLGWYWFSWKLSLVIFLAIMGNNMERAKRNLD